MLADWQYIPPYRFQDIVIASSSEGSPASQTACCLSILRDSKYCSTEFLKRTRPPTDVDGEGSENMQRKKRRLRLQLITSRLSEPYATPPTHINSRKAVRVGVWARQRVMGRDLLRKAAILNSIRIQKREAREADQLRPEVANLSSSYDVFRQVEINSLADCGRSHQSPRHLTFSAQQFVPPLPSPLGLSNYDAFDQDDFLVDGDAEEVAGSDTIYSDFSVLDPSSLSIEDYDSLRPFDNDTNEQELVKELGEEVMGLIIENEKQDEVEVAVHGPQKVLRHVEE